MNRLDLRRVLAALTLMIVPSVATAECIPAGGLAATNQSFGNDGFGGSTFDAQSGIDFNALFQTGCGASLDLSNADHGRYLDATQSGATLNYFLDLVNERAADGLTSFDGEDKQIVEPDAALAAFGGSMSSDGWRQRVELAFPIVPKTGKSSCQTAIEALKAVACANQADSNCALEASYEQRCTNATGTAELGACVTAVDAYVGQCFGSGEAPFQVVNALGLTCGSGEVCSASMAQITGQDFQRSAITATHCNMQSTLFSIQPDLSMCLPADTGRQSVVGHGATYFDAEVLAMLGRAEFLPVAQPATFAQTFLGGSNKFVVLRNIAATRYNDAGGHAPNLPPRFELMGPVLIDRSALCTVVDVDASSITHTCQSASGTSGGPLIQDIGQGFRLVGINLGSTSATSGASNEGDPLPEVPDN